jgi:hypothetical protein
MNEKQEKIKKLEEELKILQNEVIFDESKLNFPKINITIEQLNAYVDNLRKEGRWFDKDHPDYLESLRHPLGLKKEEWYIPNKK